MPSIQIKHVPEDVHRKLRTRAAERGQSLQEYLLAHLTEQARQPTVEELFERMRDRRGGRVTAAAAVAILREERDSR